MTSVRVRGFKIFADRHGKMRCYHRCTGHKINLEEHPIGSAGFFAECERIRAIVESKTVLAPRPGTLGGLIEVYFATEHFKNLAAVTRRDYLRCAGFLAPIADTPVHLINTVLIAGIHDKAAAKIGWRRANYLRTFLSEVFRHCIPKGLISSNFAKDVILKARPKALPRANRPWRPEELEVVLDHAAPHLRVVLALMANTGLDPSDALRLRRDQIDGATIWGIRGKTGNEIAIPVGPTLRAALKDSPRHNAVTILATARGTPWTYDGFSTAWHRFKRKLEAEGVISCGLTPKGLRHTVATTLREAGMDERSIADLLGQKTPAMARHYSRDANLAAKNRKTMLVLERANKARSKGVKPSSKKRQT
jgi:integrase